MEGKAEIVCVTGASGFIGSWLVMKLLQRGYIVQATVRDPANESKVRHLLELPKADANLSLWKADLAVQGSFDEAIRGCSGVFHVASPTDIASQDPENEVIKPAVDGAVDIVRSCSKAKTVRRLVFVSSAGAVVVQEHRRHEYDETCWSDVDFIRDKKMTGWMYLASKTLAEKAAWEAAKENGIDFISVLPTLVVGPFIMPSMPPSLITALSLITGNEDHYSILKQCRYVHQDDLCNALIFLFENSRAEGRYICSSHDATILELAEMLRKKYPAYNIPTEFEGIDENSKIMSSKKLMELGFEFKYSLEDMYVGAIEECQKKGLIPCPSAKGKI